MSKAMQAERKMWSKHYTYDEWMEAQGIPIYRGYYIEDLRTLQLGWWDERQCNSAFIQLVGQEGVTSARVTEIPRAKRCRRSSSLWMRLFMWSTGGDSPRFGQGRNALRKRLNGRSIACSWCPITTRTSSVTCRATNRCGCCTTTGMPLT